MAARSEDASHFCERLGPGSHIAQSKRHRNHIKGGLRERKPQSIRSDEIFHPFTLGYPQHRAAKIGAHDHCSRASRAQRERKVPAPCRQIQNPVGTPLPNHAGRPPPPEKIQSSTE